MRIKLLLTLLVALQVEKSEPGILTIIGDGLDLVDDLLGKASDMYGDLMDVDWLEVITDMVGNFQDRTDGILDDLNDLYGKQLQQMQRNHEDYINIMLALNGIEGRFDSFSSQVRDIDGKLVDVSLMLGSMDGKLDSMADMFLNMNERIESFSEQLSDISSRITDQTLKLKVEIKFQNFFTLMSRIRRYFSQLELITVSYSTNSSGLVYYIDQLVTDYRRENLEYEIVNYIDFEFVGSDSLINSFIELITAIQPTNRSPIASTTGKMIFDFYTNILRAVSEGNSFLKLCYLLRGQLMGEKFPEDELYLKLRYSIHNLVKSLKKSLNKVNSIEHTESYVNLQWTGNLDSTSTATKLYTGKLSADPGFVITGVRFKVEYGIIFLQIQVGQLGPMGTVNQATVHWQPLPKNVSDYVEGFETKENSFGMDKYWFDEKFITGVQLYKFSGDLIRLRLFGKAIDSQSFAFGMMKSAEDSKPKYTFAEVKLVADTKTPGLASGSKVTHADYKITKNVAITFAQENSGETELPFFDTSEVSFDIKSPLTGIGFYQYTNNDDYAGFIRPYLVALDYKAVLEV